MPNDKNPAESELTIAIARVVENFIDVRKAESDDLSAAAVFVLIERNDVYIRAQKSNRRSLTARQRKKRSSPARLGIKRDREFSYFLRDFGHAYDSEITSQDTAVAFINEYFAKSRGWTLRRVYTMDAIREYAMLCFQEGCNDVGYWLGKFDTWILVGQKL